MLIKLVSVKIAGYCPHSLFVFFMDRDKVKVHNSAKKKDSANILPSLPHPWSILHIYLLLDIISLISLFFLLLENCLFLQATFLQKVSENIVYQDHASWQTIFSILITCLCKAVLSNAGKTYVHVPPWSSKLNDNGYNRLHISLLVFTSTMQNTIQKHCIHVLICQA